MLEAFETKEVVQGVKGPSTMVALQHFDHVNAYVIDYMHNMLLGE
jgi:hypothetical protein